MPPAYDSAFVPGATATMEVKSRPFGIRSIVSFWIDANEAFCLTSMRGDSPVTCTVSARPATSRAMSTVSSLPSSITALPIFAVLKPCSVAVTSYTPGGTAGNR